MNFHQTIVALDAEGHHMDKDVFRRGLGELDRCLSGCLGALAGD